MYGLSSISKIDKSSPAIDCFIIGLYEESAKLNELKMRVIDKQF